MIKKIVIGIIVAAIVILSSAGFIYAHNTERQKTALQEAGPGWCGRNFKGNFQRNHEEYEQLCNEYMYQFGQDCDGQCEQIRSQYKNRLNQNEDGQCMENCNQCRNENYALGRKGRTTGR